MSITVWFRNRSIGFRILAGISLALLVAAAVGVGGLYSLSRTNAAAQDISSKNLAALDAASSMRIALDNVRMDIYNHAFASTPTEQDTFDAKVTDDLAALRAAADGYLAINGSAEATATVQHFLAQLDEYESIWEGTLKPADEAHDMAAFARSRDHDIIPIVGPMIEDLTSLVTMERDEAAAGARSANTTYTSSVTLVTIMLAAGLALAIALGICVARGIVGSLRTVVGVAESIERGDLTARTGLDREDELGHMGRSLDSALESLGRVIGTVTENATTLASAAEELAASTSQISAAAQEAAAQGGVVAAAAEQVSRNVETVSSGAQQMGASIQEISTNATRASSVSADAVAKAAAASQTIRELGSSSEEIGNIVKLITTIAGQTNLLALNATIEAARAGEAGRGFAVVAGEVKDLAQATAKATDDIARLVEAIQGHSSAAVGAITDISDVIGAIDGFQATISAAVEEQTATTSEISRSVSEAALGTVEIAQNITGVATASEVTAQGVDEAQVSVSELARMSETLLTLVGRFEVNR